MHHSEDIAKSSAELTHPKIITQQVEVAVPDVAGLPWR